MERDWRGTMERVYRFLDLDIEPAVPGMEDYLERSCELKRHPHHYSLEMFGLSPGEVRERMRRYIDRFDVPMEDTLGEAARRRSG
jgi:hypothetical protein